MNYKLAKQLKDAGFPQNIKEDEIRWTKGFENIKNPTLSELIEECGKEFKSLERAKRSRTWWAFGFGAINVNAKTPEEAVAKLWLKLNK